MTPKAGGRFDSPHFGLDMRYTWLGFVVLVALLGGLLLTRAIPALVLTEDNHRFALWILNGVTGAVLFAILAATPVAILYGLRNGGPVLASSIPVLPVLVGYLLTGQRIVSVDVTLALAGGSVGAVAATGRTWLYARQQGDSGAQRYASTVAVGTAISFAGVVTSGISLWRLAQTAGDHLFPGLLGTTVLLVLALGGLCVLGLLIAVPDLPSRFDVKRP